MKEILKSTISILLAALIIFGCWIGIKALETHLGFDLATKIINVQPSISQTNDEIVDSLGRIALTVESPFDFEYATIKITIDTTIRHENVFIRIENLHRGEEREIKHQLTLEQLSRLKTIKYEIVRCKLR